jgi:hypothetical protein
MNILLKPDTAGATRTLVRSSESAAARNCSTPVTATLGGKEHQEQPPSRQMEEEAQTAEHLSFNRKLLQLEQRLQSTEENRSRLQEALAAAQTALDEQSGLFQNEREKLQSEWEIVKNRLDAAEAQEKAVAEALRTEQGRKEETAERHAEELQRFTLVERDLEQKLQAAEKERVRLLEALQVLEGQVAGKTEELLRERAVFEQKQQHGAEVARSEKYELEEQYKVAAAENVRLRDSLQAAETRIVGHIEQHRMEMEQQESARLAMEKQNRGLQERVARLEETNSRLAFEQRELLAQLETSRLESETHASELADELHRIIGMHDELVGKRRPELGARQGKTEGSTHN